MLNPSIGKLLHSYQSRYQLVIDVARRARVIADRPDSEKISLEEKPVNLAIEELVNSVNSGENNIS